MNLDVKDQKDFTVIKFNKNSVLGTEGAEFQNSILDTLDKGVNSIIIDMSMVEYITSWGIGMLVHAFTTATNRNSQLSLSGVTKKVHEILSKVKLDTIFHISDLS
ncbi:MAG: STAS domain-containing protein [Ignavibacteriales bacterium]|nr:STAS domain-containing protein [Ignavibacteriales bacterium]